MKELLADIKSRLLNGEYKNEEHIIPCKEWVLTSLGGNLCVSQKRRTQ
jgi:hypothetical protein